MRLSKKIQKKNIIEECSELASELFRRAAGCVGKKPANGAKLSLDEREDLFEMATDIANDLAAFGGQERIDRTMRKAFLRSGKATLYALKVYAGEEKLVPEQCQTLLYNMGFGKNNAERYAKLHEEDRLSRFADEVSDYYYSLFQDEDDKDEQDIEPKLKTRFLTEYPFRFPDMEARKKRAAELRAFPLFPYSVNLQMLADGLENEKTPTENLADDYAKALSLIAGMIYDEKIDSYAVNNDAEFLFVYSDMATEYSGISINRTLDKTSLTPGEPPKVPIHLVARQLGATLLDEVKELSCAAPTGDDKFDGLRGLAADVSYTVARELMQFCGGLEKRINFDFIAALASNMEIVVNSLSGRLDMRESSKNLRDYYNRFVKSFEDEVEGAKERCHVLTEKPPKDELEILRRLAELTHVKMQAYNLEFETAETSSYCSHCYATQLADELDEDFEEKYAPRLNLLANGMERLASDLHLPDGRADVYASCAFAFRQYLNEDEPDAMYEQVLMRFSCALVELAGLILCGGISAREAAHKCWLDEEFLTELSQRQGVKDYCVAMKRMDGDLSS